MPRESGEVAAQSRKNLIAAASRLFRRQGTHVSLSAVTAEVGLTNGGFYRHFASKEALLEEATEQAFNDLRDRLAGFASSHEGDHEAARAALIEYYLSSPHRDDLTAGCPASGLAADASRGQLGENTRAHYLGGVRDLVAWIMGTPGETPSGSPLALTSASGADSDAAAYGVPDELSGEAMATLSTMAGALMLSRATTGSPLSEQFLSAARKTLLHSKPHPTARLGG